MGLRKTQIAGQAQMYKLRRLDRFKKFPLTESEIERFKTFYAENGWEASSKEFGLNKSAVMNLSRKLGIRVNKEVTLKLRGEKMTGKTISTPAIDKFIQENYLTINVNQLSIKVKLSETFVKCRLRQLGLVIPAEIIEQRKKDSRIKYGHVPSNKGKTWDELGIPQETRERMLTTAFKKSQKCHNELSDGVITTRHNHKERKSPPYKWIRLAKGKWEMLHVHNWKKIHGEVPAGHIIVFKDGNSMNCEPDNLEKITLEENMKRNTIHRYPTELKEIIRLTNKLERTLKKKQDEKQTA
jgi:hypothetical protein